MDQDLFVAELSLAQARLNELLSLVQLYKALGVAGSNEYFECIRLDRRLAGNLHRI
jgi:hypothetical protein